MKPAPSVPQVIGLCRVSTDKQEDSGLGLEDQRLAIEAYAKGKGLPIKNVYLEAISGKTPLSERGVLREALEAVGKGDVFVVHQRDRLSRDPIVCWIIEEMLSKKGASFASTLGEGSGDETPQGKMFRRLMDVVNQMNREIIVLRTKSTKKNQKAAGFFIGGDVPYGWSRNGAGSPLVENQKEQAVIAEAKRLRASGLSWSQVCISLAKAGYYPREAKKWHNTQVQRICK